MAYFRCTKNTKPKIEYLYDWDFTQSFTDKIANKTAEVIGNVTRDSEGAKFLKENGQGSLELFSNTTSRIDLTGKTLEIEFSADLKNTYNYVDFIITDSVRFRWSKQNNIWNVYKTGGNYPYTQTFSKINFQNTTLRFVHTSELLKVYELNKTTKEFDLVYSGSPYTLYPYSVAITSNGTYCYFDLIVKAVRIFENL